MNLTLHSSLEIQPVRPERGITLSLLIAQVKNTVPFLFEENLKSTPRLDYLRLLQKLESSDLSDDRDVSHLDYFRTCVSAHMATVASFVPTDVDNHIRFHLWNAQLPLDVLDDMIEFVEQCHEWDMNHHSTRYIDSPVSQMSLRGHDGEWFSMMGAAYSACRKRIPSRTKDLADRIVEEVIREGRIFEWFAKQRDGIGALKAATLIAHNLGDLDRVMDQWNLPADDPLRSAVYKAGHQGRESLPQGLILAGDLNKKLMASENHRHFALRKPRCLRQHRHLLLGIGPFFDDWGYRVSQEPTFSEFDLSSVIESLIDGWNRLKGPIGYARALAGIEQGISGGLAHMCELVPKQLARELRQGPLRQLMSVSQQRFEQRWNAMALKLIAGAIH